MDITPQIDELSKTLKAFIDRIQNQNKTDYEEEIFHYDQIEQTAYNIKTNDNK